MSSASGEADANEVGAQCFLPALGCIPGAIKAQLELAQKSRAVLRVLLGQGQLNEHVPLDLSVQVGPSARH